MFILDKRYIGAAILLPFLIFLVIGGVFLKYGLMVLSLGGMYEFYMACKRKNYKPIEYIGYAMCLIYYFTLGNNFDGNLLMAIIVLSLIIMLCIPVINLQYTFIDIAITLLGFVYVAVFFSLITLVNYKAHGAYLLWLVFISSWLCDTTAYYVGRYIGKYIGKTKICPQVSPKKTLAGSIGGLLGSAVACTIYGIYLNNVGISISIVHFIIIGLLCGLFCQFGDFVASSIKRYVDLKDYSNLIPGHGGVLDRFDSILFASVIVYYYLTLILKI